MGLRSALYYMWQHGVGRTLGASSTRTSVVNTLCPQTLGLLGSALPPPRGWGRVRERQAEQGYELTDPTAVVATQPARQEACSYPSFFLLAPVP